MRQRIIILLLGIFVCISMSAQSQQGYVKSLGRPHQKGVALSGVSVRVKGAHNTVLSSTNGTFLMLMAGKKNGDAYQLQQVQKPGYELNEQGVIGRRYAFSDKVPLTIVMVSSRQLQEDRLRIENNAYQVAEKNYNARLALMEQQKEAGIITAEEYQLQIQILQDKFEKYQSLIDDLADHYAHVDYDNLDEKEQEINTCIENGTLERADSLLQQMGVQKRAEGIARRLATGQRLMDEAQQDLEAVLKQQSKDAEYLYQLYTIALARYDNEKARFYIETRAELDTTNVEWLLDAAKYIATYSTDYERAISYYQMGLSQSRKQYGEDHLITAMFYNNLGMTYYFLGDYSQALNCYDKTISVCESADERNVYILGAIYNNIGMFHVEMSKYEYALQYYKKAISLYEQENDKQSAHLGKPLIGIGCAYLYLGDYSEALKYTNRGVSLLKGCYGEDHPEVAKGYTVLGGVYAAQGNIKEAMKCHSNALSISKKTIGMNHPDVALTLGNIGNLYLEQGDTLRSLKLYEEALAIYEATNTSNLFVATLCYNMAYVYKMTDNYNKALLYGEKSLDIRRDILGEDDLQTAASYDLVASIFYLEDENAKAIELYMKSLGIYKKQLGDEHEKVKGLMMWIEDIRNEILEDE